MPVCMYVCAPCTCACASLCACVCDEDRMSTWHLVPCGIAAHTSLTHRDVHRAYMFLNDDCVRMEERICVCVRIKYERGIR
uniref:Putative secreted protein n=1 Tax=Anopheles triannulatus TaxID=58253 RepID=A0A2M4B124_9DIPT